MTGPDVANVDALIAALDERSREAHEKWDMYRCHGGGWIITLNANDSGIETNRTVRGATFLDALQAAWRSPRLPVIPPEPERFTEQGYRVEKLGAKWALMHASCGDLGLPRFPTRKAATARAELHYRAAEARWTEWNDKHGHLARTGVAGVDFYWGRR